MNSSESPHQAEALRSRIANRAKLYTSLYLLVLPTTLSLLVFSYYPKIDVVIMSFFRWNPPFVQDPVGFQNYLEAFSDPIFWSSFKLVGIILVANLFKLWPGIFAAIALHRLANRGLRYVFQVSFVVPMIIPSMVWLLIWKSFYDPSFGLLNRFLNATGGMQLLNYLDTALPQVAGFLSPITANLINPIIGSLGGVFLFGALVIFSGFRKNLGHERWSDYTVQLLGPIAIWFAQMSGAFSTPTFGLVGTIFFIAWCVWLARRLGSGWVLWTLFTIAGLAIFWEQLWRLPLLMLASFALFELVRTKFDFFTGKPALSKIGLGFILVGSFFVLFGEIWTSPTEQFNMGTPAWLGNQNLIIPALLFWGFPWVGTVGVLIYLSGLQNISEDVYEAAELDGVTPLGMIFKIELPLIMTQVRINLIFMTISTLTAYEAFLILLGPDGGPGNVGMVPGLYMFGSAFAEGRFGYACALGMVMFVVILTLTIIYQRYVKVEK
ncbi:MAG: carbohydrate ABC transporter permease [Puniceicoccaceae bacterium]